MSKKKLYKSRKNKIEVTITNDEGRLSKKEIDKMVKRAKKFKEEDEKEKSRVERRNRLENFCYLMRDQLSETIRWLEENENSTEEEIKGYENKINIINK